MKKDAVKIGDKGIITKTGTPEYWAEGEVVKLHKDGSYRVASGHATARFLAFGGGWGRGESSWLRFHALSDEEIARFKELFDGNADDAIYRLRRELAQNRVQRLLDGAVGSVIRAGIESGSRPIYITLPVHLLRDQRRGPLHLLISERRGGLLLAGVYGAFSGGDEWSEALSYSWGWRQAGEDLDSAIVRALNWYTILA